MTWEFASTKKMNDQPIKIRRNKTIQKKEMTIRPEVIWNLDVSKDKKSYQENYTLLFPRYISAIDDE
ncbi:MAG: hypothetical protein QG646_2786 [Euryarchaeota archaeon]|nr:hypothetical protein [Euryarchaeota archaeon]